MKGDAGSLAQAVKSRLSIVEIVRRYVDLRQNGRRWVAPCPFHQETKPSFSVNEEEGFFYCFGCQASGDLIDFYCRINGLDFKDGLAQLAEEAGISLRDVRPDPARDAANAFRRQALRLHDMARAHFTANLNAQGGAECRAYMKRRGLSPEIAKAFDLGWTPREWQDLTDAFKHAGVSLDLAVRAGLLGTNDKGRVYDRFRGRLMFPIRDLSGKTIAFGGRIIADEDEAKYINSGDSAIYKKGEHLYGLAQARRGIAQYKTAMLTEGYMDVLTLHQFGFANACGVLGTALTEQQVKRLSGFCSTVELLFDGDNPGRKAALRAAEMFLVRGLRCRVILLPDGEDIDSLLRGPGPDAFRDLQKSAPDGLEFCIRSLAAGYSPKDIMAWTQHFLRQIETPELLSFYISRVAKGLGLNEAELRAQAVQKRPAAPAQPGTGMLRPASVPRIGLEERRDQQIILFLVRYPAYAATLREMGVEDVFSTSWARNFWTKIYEHGEAAVTYLDEREKAFWVRHRLADAPPEAEEAQLQAVCDMVRRIRAQKQGKSYKAALIQSAGKGGQADIELLLAHLKTLGRCNE